MLTLFLGDKIKMIKLEIINKYLGKIKCFKVIITGANSGGRRIGAGIHPLKQGGKEK